MSPHILPELISPSCERITRLSPLYGCMFQNTLLKPLLVGVVPSMLVWMCTVQMLIR